MEEFINKIKEEKIEINVIDKKKIERIEEVGNVLETIVIKNEEESKLWSKNKLQEYIQMKSGKKNILPKYDSSRDEFPFYKCRVIVSLIDELTGDRIEKTFSSINLHKKKKDAEMDAAYEACVYFGLNEKKDKLRVNTQPVETLLKVFMNPYCEILDIGILFLMENYSMKQLYPLFEVFLHSSYMVDLNIVNIIKEYFNIEEVRNYERLEFLGDSFIQGCVSRYLIETSTLGVGELTKKRSDMVNNKTFGNICIYTGLSSFILFSNDLNGTKIPADVLEAFIGAIWLVFGDEKAKYAVKRLIIMKDFDFTTKNEVIKLRSLMLDN